MMADEYDLIILGGGCAGLSLAKELTLSKKHTLKVLVLEARTQYENDRTWCFWKSKTPLDVTHQWDVLQIKNQGQKVDFSYQERPYQMLSAQQFYDKSLKSIQQSTNTELKLGVTINDLSKQGNNVWEVKTSAGSFTAKNIVDTRPPKLTQSISPLMWQSFYGHEIESVDPIFDSSKADLMDFLPAHNDIAFIYFLPISTTRALIEFTVFSPTQRSEQDMANDLEKAMQQRLGNHSYTILRSEHATLPMGLGSVPTASDPSMVRVGVMAGAARPSTGYAFQRIQQWAKLCATSFTQSGFPLGHAPDPWVMRAMDTLFLKVLRSQAHLAPNLFFTLFRDAKPKSVIRFLSGEAGLLDYLAVIMALPARPFLQEIARSFTFQPHRPD